jgi:hypothetical protein
MGKREERFGKGIASDATRRAVEQRLKEALLMGKLHTAKRYCKHELDEGGLSPKDRVAHISLHVALSWVDEIMDAFKAIDAMYANPEPMTDEEADDITRAGEAILEKIEQSHNEDLMAEYIGGLRVDDVEKEAKSQYLSMEEMPEFFQKAFAQEDDGNEH